MTMAGKASAMAVRASTTLEALTMMVTNPRIAPQQANSAAGLKVRQRANRYIHCHLVEAFIVSRSPLRTWATPS